MEYETVKHIFEPVYDGNSSILILGSLPSVKSRENHFYYGYPKNRFWKLMSELLGCDEPGSIDEKKAMLLKNHIAVWDVIAQCDIAGSSDSSIRNVIPNDISLIVDNSNVGNIYANGAKAYELYNKYCLASVKIPAVRLPSTSPANAACSMDKLKSEWKIIFQQANI